MPALQQLDPAECERLKVKPGEMLSVTPDPANVHLFDAASGKRLN